MEWIGKEERQRGHMFMFFMVSVRGLLWSAFMDRRRCCMVRFISNLSRVAACVQHRFVFTVDKRVETISWMACFRGEIISRMACLRGGDLAYLWGRTTWGEIVWKRMDNCEAKGIQTQSSSVNWSPCPISLTFPSGVGVSMVWRDRKLRGRAVITMMSEFRDR